MTKKAPSKSASKPGKPVLLSGGNPQIPKGEGDVPVQAYLAPCRAESRASGAGWTS